jgi:hypothetical protein
MSYLSALFASFAHGFFICRLTPGSLLFSFEGDVEGVFCRDFQASYTQKDGTVKNVELKADGANIPVTSANKQEYVDRYVEWILTESVKAQFDAFLNGFKITCEGRAIRMCRQEELEQLVCGSPDIPLEQLEDVATYVDYERNDQYMTYVNPNQAAMLKFVLTKLFCTARFACV